MGSANVRTNEAQAARLPMRHQALPGGRRTRASRLGVLHLGSRSGTPEYVAKAKVREWRKLYQEVMGKGKKPADAPEGAGGGGVNDRIAQLKAKLT